jgi:hypothetical protein
VNREEDKNWQSLRELLGGTNAVPADPILEAMRSPALEVQAEVFRFVMDPSRAERVVPPLELCDYQTFLVSYLSRCISENPNVDEADPWEPVHSRGAACYELANWFRYLWSNSSPDRIVLEETKNVIRRLYLEGDKTTQQALIQEVLEHLFENPSVKDFFSDWTSGPIELRTAFDEASKWSREGGHGPLWESR